jgi:PAS domain S-box-containing protein
VNMNRHSIAKYMEMLTISGHVEMRSFGPSKVYYLSQRVPISAMLSFSSDMICTIDRDMKVIQVNDAFIEFFGHDRENILGQNIRELDSAFPVNNGMIKLIGEALDGKAYQHNIRIQSDGKIRYVRMKLIPTAFDDGTTGVVFIGEDITAEKQAEQALKASKMALEKQVRMTTADLAQSDSVIRAVLDTLPVGVIVVDAVTTRISYVSPHITRLYGMDLEGKVMDASLEGLTILRPDGQAVGNDEAPMNRALRNGETIYMAEHILRLKDNREIYVLMNSTPVYGPDGQITAAVSTISDITERKLAEEALCESEERFRAVFDRAALGIAITNPQGYLVDSNQIYQAILGYTKEELLQKRIYDVTYPDDVDKSRDLERQLNEGSIDRYLLENRYIRKDGRIIWGKLNVSAIRDQDGNLKYNLGVLEDVTGQKAIEKRFIETMKLLQASLQASPMAINAIDLDTNVILWNKMAEKVFGWTEEEVLGKPLPTMPADMESEREKLRAILNCDRPLSGIRIHLIRKDGTPIDLIVFSSPLYDENGRLSGALGFFYYAGVK